MSDQAAIFELPYNLFLMQRMEFVVICGDHLAASVMRVIESEMIKLKEAWQTKAEKAIEEKKTPPTEPKSYWTRLSLSQIIARLYMYDSGKLKKPESEDLDSPEWVEYRTKKALSISKGTLRKAIEQLKSLGFLLERSKPGDEFGAPIWTLHKENVQKALKALPSNPFTIFHTLGGGSKFEYGGEVQNLNVPPPNSERGDMQNLNVPGPENGGPHLQNLEVDIDSRIDSLEDTGIDIPEESTYPRESHSDDFGSHEPTHTLALMQDEPSHAGTTNYPGKRWPDGSLTPDENGCTDALQHLPGSQERDPSAQGDTGQSSPAREPVARHENGLSTSQASSPQERAKVVPPPEPGKPGRGRATKVPPVELTPEGRKVYEAWCSLFRSPPRTAEKTVECANDLYFRLVPWCKELQMPCKGLLKEIKGWLYATDPDWYRKKGVTLCDIGSKFESWQSAKTEELEAKQVKATASTSTVSGLPRWKAPAGAMQA